MPVLIKALICLSLVAIDVLKLHYFSFLIAATVPQTPLTGLAPVRSRLEFIEEEEQEQEQEEEVAAMEGVEFNTHPPHKYDLMVTHARACC